VTPPSSARRLRDPAWTVVASLAIAAMPALLVFGWLRETPGFWRTDGGYPVFMRDLVAATFYPLLLWVIASGAWLTWRMATHPPASVASLRRRVLCLMALALLTGATLMVTAANNIENVLDGRPLHWHGRL